MTNEEANRIILDDIKQAKSAKSEIDSKIERWLAEYDGEGYGNEKEGRSKIVVKDIKKAIEWFVPTASEPFLKKGKIVSLNGITAEDVERAEIHERLINYQFNRKFDYYNFLHEMFKISSTEGTVIIRTGWDLREKEESKNFDNITAEQLQMITSSGLEIGSIEDNGDGTFNAKAINRIILENKPTATILKNGDCFPDPSVDKIEDMSFFAYRYEMTISDLRNIGKYNDEDIDELLVGLERNDSQLESTRNTALKGYGKDTDYTSSSDANKKVTVYEYWGYLDMNNDGISEPVFATLVNDKILEIVDNPYPDKELPFVVIPFSKVMFGFWGDSMAEFLSDGQKIRTSLMRGFIDNVAQANNAKKFIKKGALDPINKRKYENNLAGLIEVNGDRNDMWDGEFNQINPSVYSLFEIIQQENESLSGINRTMQGVDSRGLNDSATGASIQQGNSQRRMMDIIRRHSNGLKQVFRKWIAYNKEFLSDNEVMRISGKHIEFTRDDISGEFDIDITVGTDGVSEAKVNQMTMLMQQVGGLAGVATVPPQFFNLMISRMADEWGYPDIAEMLENPPSPEPSEEQLEAQRLELEKLRQEVEEMKSKAILNMSKANAENVESKKSALGIKDE